tara:strand:+ start:462 stop:725 length:264 start_codon:yes stop_codon:yes gene_type:complete
MIKEIKYLIFILIISVFFFLTAKYYFSDNNKKNSYRSFNTIGKRIDNHIKNLPILKDDTVDIIEYVDQSNNNKKKKFNFWKLLESSE